MQQFKEGNAEDGPVGSRHPGHAPMGGTGLKPTIDIGLLPNHTLHQQARKGHERRAAQPAGQEAFYILKRRGGIGVPLVEHLHGNFTGTGTAGHIHRESPCGWGGLAGGGNLGEERDHFNGRNRTLLPLVAGSAAGSGLGLIERVAGEHAKEHRQTAGP